MSPPRASIPRLSLAHVRAVELRSEDATSHVILRTGDVWGLGAEHVDGRRVALAACEIRPHGLASGARLLTPRTGSTALVLDMDLRGAIWLAAELCRAIAEAGEDTREEARTLALTWARGVREDGGA